jgi:NAD(P)-dependent dehydrogenase (short-subunit alcohol dehydrogenase family)
VADVPFDPAGAVAVVTGATRGIGRQAAIALGRAGARLVLVGRTGAESPSAVLPGSLDEVAGGLAAEGIEARTVQADLTDPAETKSIVDRTLEWYGGCDILVNNAAYTSNGPIIDIPWSRWQKAMRAQVVAPLQLVQGFVPGMQARGRGRVVNVSSAAAVALASGLALYSVSKQAMERLNDYLHLELGGGGVTFNVLRIERVVATEGWRHVYDTQGAEVATMGGSVTDVIAPEVVGRQIEWMVRQPDGWSGQVVGCDDVSRAGGPATVSDGRMAK